MVANVQTKTQNPKVVVAPEMFVDAEHLQEAVTCWWHALLPAVDDFFERIVAFPALLTPAERSTGLADLRDIAHQVRAARFPLPVTTARRQLLGAMDGMVLSLEYALEGAVAESTRANHRAVALLRDFDKTMANFGLA